MRTDHTGPIAWLFGVVILSLLVVPSVAVADGIDGDRIEQAQAAAERAEFDELVPLLEPVIDDESADAAAHLLYALGLAYEAQTTDDQTLHERTDHHIERALDADPGLEVDPLVFPPRFVVRVEGVRDTIDGDTTDSLRSAGPEILYFERRIEHRSRLPLYLPGGVGQFYNDMPFRGATFAAVQLLGLATNVVAHWTIESMRTSSGHIGADDIGRARGWRRAQYAGIATFAVGWLLSAVEAHLNFEPRTVRIRHLDEPPRELETLPPGQTGLGIVPAIQWTLTF